MEDVILKLVHTVNGLKAELAAAKQRYERNRAAEVAGHQAVLEAVIADVEAMTAEAAGMEAAEAAPAGNSAAKPAAAEDAAPLSMPLLDGPVPLPASSLA